MKSKKRRHASSDESEETEASEISSSSSSSESEDSSVSGHRHKKKRKRAESSESESDSGDHKHSKKRKHKKKKKKHGKRKRKSHSVEQNNGSVFELESISEGEISTKKKRKHKHHKHGKRDRSSSISPTSDVDGHTSRRLHSVVKERRESSEERSQPVRTYYQKEYRRSHSAEPYDRQSEVQRFYRGSSKEHRPPYTENYQQYNRPHNDRYEQYHRDNKYDKNRDKPGPSSQYLEHNDNYRGRQRDFNEYNKRPPRYDANRLPQEEFQRRMPPRDEPYHSRQDRGPNRGYNRFNQFEDRGPKKREYDDNREQWDRRGPGPERFQHREYPDKKEDINRRYRDDDFTSDSDYSTEKSIDQKLSVLQRYFNICTLNDHYDNRCL